MNRYENDGIVRDLAEGKRIIVCASTTYAHHIFKTVLEALENTGVNPTRVIRTNGQERIEVGDGILCFARSYDALRGIEADKALISVSVRESPAFREQWFPNARLATRNGAVEQISG